jgi:hypothetical protein
MRIDCNYNYKNKVLWGIFESERDEEAGRWGNTHKDLHNLHSLPSIIRMVKSKRMKWVGHVA